MPPIVALLPRPLTGGALALLVLGAHLVLLRPPVPPAMRSGVILAPARPSVQLRLVGRVEARQTVATSPTQALPPSRLPRQAASQRSDPRSPANRAVPLGGAVAMLPAAVDVHGDAPAEALADAPVDVPVDVAVDAGADAPPPAPSGFAVRLPAPVKARYQLWRGGVAGRAELRWWNDGERYEAQLAGEVGESRSFEWRSQGAVAGERGVEPMRFVVRQSRQAGQAANFRRDAGRIGFSGPSMELPLWAGTQDRLSWMVQLAGIVAAEPARLAEPGSHVELPVVGARGDAALWRFESLGLETLELPSGAVLSTLKLIRPPHRPYDLGVEIWLDAREPRLPLRLRLLPTGAPALELRWLVDAPAEGERHPNP